MKSLLKITFVICLLTGCGNLTGANEEVRPMHITEHAVIAQDKSDHAKKIVLSMDEVVEIKGVNDNKGKIYLAPRVKHFDRIRLKGIRKKGYDSVKKQYPNAKVFVSTDQKIYMELEKLEKELKNKSISEQRLKKQLKKLEEMMKG
jgi:hypothetical protein